MIQGIILYVDISQLEQMPASVKSIYTQLQYIQAQYQAAQQSLSACQLSSYFDTYTLHQYGNRFNDLTLKVKKLETTLSEIAGIYRSYNGKLSPDAVGNLNREDLPWYKSNEGKIAIGIAVIAVAVIAVIVFPVSAAAVGALAGAAGGAVLGGVIGGCSSKKAGGNFRDGFADGFMWGSVSGALSGAVGVAAGEIGVAAQGAGYVKNAATAIRVVAAIGDGAVDSAINISQSVSNGQEIDAGDAALAFVAGALMSYGTSKVVAGIPKNRVKKAKGSENVIKTSYGKSSGKIGDFTELEGSTVDEILDRIPDEAVLRELYPVQGGATEGFEFKWVQNGQTYRVRVHNVDPSAPVGSNAYNGWVVRAQRGRRYFDPTINDFREAKYFNPNGPDYDEVIINDTHIPILDPYQN